MPSFMTIGSTLYPKTILDIPVYRVLHQGSEDIGIGLVAAQGLCQLTAQTIAIGKRYYVVDLSAGQYDGADGKACGKRREILRNRKQGRESLGSAVGMAGEKVAIFPRVGCDKQSLGEGVIQSEIIVESHQFTFLGLGGKEQNEVVFGDAIGQGDQQGREKLIFLLGGEALTCREAMEQIVHLFFAAVAGEAVGLGENDSHRGTSCLHKYGKTLG